MNPRKIQIRAIADEAVEKQLKPFAADVKEMFAKLDKRFDAQDAKIDQRFDALDVKIDQRNDAVNKRFDALDAKIDQRFDAVNKEIKEVHSKVQEVKDQGQDVKADTHMLSVLMPWYSAGAVVAAVVINMMTPGVLPISFEMIGK